MYIHYIAINCIHESDFIMDRPNGRIDFLFLFVRTPCTFIIENRTFAINCPSALLLGSNIPHRYFPTDSEYVDDYLHFAVEDQNEFLNELTFPLNQPIQIANDSYITDILRMLYREFNLESRNSKQIFSLFIKALMIKVGEEWLMYKQQLLNNAHYHDLQEIRNRILNTPNKNWSVDELADLAHLSHAYFQVMYKKTFGVTCITDVINTKISHAKILLTSTTLSVNQIAQELGYNEVYHFIRQFKKNCGITPGAFRKKFV